MARYDQRWMPPRETRYDEPFGRRPRGGPGGWRNVEGDWSGERGSRAMGERMERGGGEWAGEDASGIYGPARYGLGPYYQRLINRRRPDEELKEEVEEAIFYDTWVDAEAISVDVDDGIVTLRGELPSFEEVRYATDDAWDVDGVRGVRSELSVRER
jgi:osmotically-inducible protein OsmY